PRVPSGPGGMPDKRRLRGRRPHRLCDRPGQWRGLHPPPHTGPLEAHGGGGVDRGGEGVIYDVHAHCIPQAVLDLLRERGSDFGIEVVAGEKGEQAVLAGRVKLAPFRDFLTDMDARLRAMDATGVDVQLLSGWIDLTAYSLPAEAGARWARAFNEVLADEAEKHPERFVPLGTVPLQDPRRAAEELRHAVEELGMAGVQIATTVDQTDLGQD